MTMRRISQVFLAAWAFPMALSAQSPRRELRLFDLDSIVHSASAWAPPIPGAPRLRGSPQGDDDYDLGVVLAAEDDDVEFGLSRLGVEETIDLVKRHVDRDSWENERNRIEVVDDAGGRRLLVVQRPEALEAIDALLGVLEAETRRLLAVELALVPPEALDGAAPGWREPQAAPWIAGDALARAVRQGGAASRFGLRFVRDGGRVAFEPGGSRSFLEDHEVNQTGVCPVIGPVVRGRSTGFFGDLRVFLSPDGGLVRADVVAGERRASSSDAERRRLPQGGIDIVLESQERIETTVVGPVGEALVVGSLRLPPPTRSGGGESPRSFAVLLRVSKRFQDAPPRSAPPRIVHAAFLTEPVPPGRSFDPGDYDVLDVPFFFDQGDAKISLVEPDDLRAALDALCGRLSGLDARVSRSDGYVFLAGTGPEVAEAAAAIEALGRQGARPVSVTLWQATVAAEALEEARAGGFLLPEGWIERLETAEGVRARLQGLSGVPGTLHAVSSRTFVEDVERVSGGFERTVIDVADPVVALVGEGLVLRVAADLVPGTSWAQLHVQGELARPPRLERKTRVRATQDVEPGEAEGAAELRAASETIEIELPEEDVDRWQHLVTAPLGRPVLLNALPDPERPGRARVLAAVVGAPELPPPR